mgnify:FL=1
MDEKSLIKKYQKEILSLKLELEQVKQGMINNASHMGSPEDIVSLKQQVFFIHYVFLFVALSPIPTYVSRVTISFSLK